MNENPSGPVLFLAIIMTILIFGIVFIPLLLIDALLLTLIWNWHMPDIFGAPVIGIPEAIAISTIVAFFRTSEVKKRSKNFDWITTWLTKDILALLIAWILTFIR